MKRNSVLNYTIIFSLLLIAARSPGGTIFAVHNTADAQLANPVIVASLTHDWFRVEGFAPNAPVAFQIYDAPGGSLIWGEDRTTDDNGFTFVASEEHPLDLSAGIYMVATDGFSTKDVLLEELTLDVFDPAADYLAGTAPIAPDGRFVWVSAGNEFTGCGMEVIADEISGAWSADFTMQPCDITDDMWGAAQIFDADGDVSEANPPPPPPQPLIAANPKDENISVYALELGTEVTLTIHDPAAPEQDFTRIAIVDYAPWAPGNPNEIIAYFDLVNEFDLRAGQSITASTVDTTNSYTVTDFAITEINVAANTASGTASPFSEIQFCAGTGECRFTSADESGMWTAPPGDPVTFVLEPGLGGFASEYEEDFDNTYETWLVLPPVTGYHDYGSEITAEYSCYAGGWAMDPDAPDEDVNVRILVDGAVVLDNIVAENFREDLESAWNAGEGGCPGGTCAFDVNLWDSVSHNQPHEIMVEAQDLQTGDWYALNETPKTLTCQSQDIYVYDIQTGVTTQITNTDDVGEYNPSWSPNGKKIVHEVSTGDGGRSLSITDVSTKVSTALPGTDKANDAVWSPVGVLIAFDTNFSDEQPNLYVMPVTGGNRQLIRENAVSPSWSPTGVRLVFQDLGDGGKLKTVGLLGQLVIEVADFGENPAWSPDGKWIAYEQDGDIWKVRVGSLGTPLAAPVQLTDMAAWDDQPTWTPNSQTIVFQSFQGTDYLNGDSDLWTVSAAGGSPTRLTGVPVLGDYDPDIGKNASKVAYSTSGPGE